MSQTYEILFTQLLAANQRKVRKEAIWKLGDYITEKSGSGQAFSDDDLTKLWKGLFYCLYMTDKSYQQEIVANKITSFIHLFKSSAECMSFARIGFGTVIQEWNGIDKYRLDKFMMLIRRLFRELLIYLKRNKWVPDEVQMYLSIIENTVICPRDYHNKVPLGVKLHFCDLYLEEIAKIGQENLDYSLILLFLQPYIQVLLFASSLLYVQAVVRDIFQYLIRQTDLVLKKDEQILLRRTGQLYSKCVLDNENEENEFVDGANDLADKEESTVDLDALDPRAGGVDVYLPQLKPDFDAVADALLEAGSHSKLKKSRRQLIYRLVRELKDTANKSYPFKLPKESHYKSPSEEEMISTALRRLKKCKAGSRSSKKKSDCESLDAELHAGMPALKKKKSTYLQKHSSSLTVAPKHTESRSTKKRLPSDFSVYELSQIKGQSATARRETRKGHDNQASGFKVSDIPSHLLSNVSKENQRVFQQVFKVKPINSDSVSPLGKLPEKIFECHLECSNAEILLKLRKQLKKKHNQSRKMKKQSAPVYELRTPGSKKTIQINLKRNQEHAFGDYCKDVQQSPIIPFSADKVPSTSVLKPSPSPILVQKPSLKTLKRIPTVATSTQHLKKVRKKH